MVCRPAVGLTPGAHLCLNSVSIEAVLFRGLTHSRQEVTPTRHPLSLLFPRKVLVILQFHEGSHVLPGTDGTRIFQQPQQLVDMEAFSSASSSQWQDRGFSVGSPGA